MTWYLLFCVFCLIVFLFDHWDEGEDIVVSTLLAGIFTSLFPVMNVLVLIGSIANISERRFTGVILKGRAQNE